MTRTKIVTLLSAVTIAGASGIAWPNLAAAETELVLNRFLPPRSSVYKSAQLAWAKDLEAASKGRIKVTIPAASLGPPPRQWDIVAKGVADVALTANAFQRKRLKLPNIASIPFTAPSAEGASIALWRTQKQFFDNANEYKGVKLLAQFAIGDSQILSTDKPILAVGDLKGVKIATTPGIPKAMLTALGATVVAAPAVKTFELISGNIVDSAAVSLGAARALRFGRFITHVTAFPGGLYRTNFSIIMNLQTWNGLSAEDKMAVDKVSGEHLISRIGKVADVEQNTVATKYLKGEGAVFHVASPAFMSEARKRVSFVAKGFLATAEKAGVNGNAALDFYRKVAAETFTKSAR